MAAIVIDSRKSQALKVIGLCVIWYLSSSIGNVIAKKLLSDFPYPVTLTMVQHLCLIVNLIPLLRWWNVRPVEPGSISTRYYWTVIIPVAAGKFLSNASAAFSIWKVPLSYAHTVKATMPLWTVMLSRLILGEKQSTSVHLSLVPIIVGVFISTATEISFQMSGLISALAATAGFSLQNIYTKKTMKDTDIHPLRLLFLLAKISTACFLPIWLLTDVYRVVHDDKMTSPEGGEHLLRCCILLALDGYLAFIQHVVAFSLISMVAPLSYAVANATKRITIITASILVLRNQVTWTNVGGMTLALTGVFLYNYTKLQQSRGGGGSDPSLTTSTSEAVLPYVRSRWDRGDRGEPSPPHIPNGGPMSRPGARPGPRVVTYDDGDHMLFTTNTSARHNGAAAGMPVYQV